MAPISIHTAEHYQWGDLSNGWYLLKQEGVKGIEVPSGVAHQFRNDSGSDVNFLVVSVPPSHGDRKDGANSPNA